MSLAGRHVAVVAFEMEGEPTGVGRYLEGLLGGIAALGETSNEGPARWTLFFKGDPFDHALWSNSDARFRPDFDRRPRARPILWEQTRLPRSIRRAAPDLLFSPSYSLPPVRGLPRLVTIHDLSFERLPQAFPWKERMRRRWLARRAARDATRVLADTVAIANELADRYALAPDRIGVVPLAVDGRFTPRAKDGDVTTRRTLGLDGPYLLVLGTVLARRRLDLVLSAFATIAADHPDLRLVIGGRNRLRHAADLDRWIAESGVADRVWVPGYLPESGLPAAYRGAVATVYLSEYEGYGLPPMESLACGTPCLVAPGLGLDDLWPNYPYRVRQLDHPSTAEALAVLLADDDGRRAVGTDGAARMAQRTWIASARQFLAELEHAYACGPRS